MVDLQRNRRVSTVSLGDRAIAHCDPAGEEGVDVEASWGVACDGAESTVREVLGVAQEWRDYGCDSAVADIAGDAARDPLVSDIVLDPERPFGWFSFAPGRWRFIYRLNAGESRESMTREDRVRSLFGQLSPEAKVDALLWASAFRLGQGQNATYRSGRWVFAGDAAHAMDPSAGAGMMVGMLGVWRRAARLARAIREPSAATRS